LDHDKSKEDGFLDRRLDGRAEVKTFEEFRRRALALGFLENEVDAMAERYGWDKRGEPARTDPSPARLSAKCMDDRLRRPAWLATGCRPDRA